MYHKILGEEVKIHVCAPESNNALLLDNDWELQAWSFSTRKKIFHKRECIPLDDGSFVVPLNTKDVGVGKMKVRFMLHIPDGDYKDNDRTEIDDVEFMKIVRGCFSHKCDGSEDAIITPRFKIKLSLTYEAYLNWEAYVDTNNLLYKGVDGKIYYGKK